MAAAPADYPFASWQAYYAALSESLSTEYYGETYPLYKELQETRGDETDLTIILSLLEAGASPQEGFNDLLKTCIVSHRYSPGFIKIDKFSFILQAFFDRGVQLDTDILHNLYVAEEPSHFEEEAFTCDARAQLIRVLIPFVPNLLSRLDDAIQWNDIDPVHWEEVEEPTTMEEFRNAIYAAIKNSYLDYDEY
jgi:hypothetical protein